MKKLFKLLLVISLCFSLAITETFGAELGEETVLVHNFEELKQAIESAPNDNNTFTIEIADDIETSVDDGFITISDGQNIVIKDDGSWKTINRVGIGRAELFNIQSGGTLTLEGQLSIAGNDYNDSHSNSHKGLITVYGEFVLKGAVIRDFSFNTYYSAAVYVSGNGVFTMIDGAINSIKGDNIQTAAVYVTENASFIMDGGYITNNWMNPEHLDNGVIIVQPFEGHSSFVMNGGEISGNKAYCGAIFAGTLNNDHFNSSTWYSDSASVVINDGLIESNEAGYSGGAISIMGRADLTVNGGDFISNTAPMGGAIAAYDLFFAFNSQRPELTAAQMASIYNLPASVCINGGNIISNYAVKSSSINSHSAASDKGCGGGIYLATTNAEINHANIFYNYADAQGGGIYVAAEPYEAHIVNAIITENTADDIGAGIWACPTGSVVEWLVNGAAVYGNVLTNGEAEDMYYEAHIAGLAASSDVRDESEYDMSLNSGDVLIKYNHSVKGGGLGTNGTYIFGVDIPVVPTITTVTPPQPPTDPGEDPEPAETPVEPIIPTPPAVVESTIETEITLDPKLDVVPKTGINDIETVKDLLLNNSKLASLSLRSDYTIPVAKASKEDPFRFLRRTLDGKYSIKGTVFADAMCDIDSDNLLLYGHNMKDGTMFSDLNKYEDKEYFDSHRNITLTLLNGEERKYQVIAVFRDRVYYDNEDVFKYYKYVGDLDERDYYEYICNILKKSEIKFDIPAYGTQLLTMSTCAYHTDNGRLVVIAKNID